MNCYLGYRFAQWGSAHLRRHTALWLAERLADLAWHGSARRRATVHANLSLLVNEPVGASSPLVREVFRNFGRYLVECFSVHTQPSPQVHVEGLQHLEAAHARGRGVIVLTGHLGNWEVGAITLHRMGWPLTVIALPHGDPRTDGLFNGLRTRGGLTVIPLGPGAMRQSLKVLKAGRLLGVLGDHVFAGQALQVSLGPHAWCVPRGPALLSVRAHAPIVPMFFLREGPGVFRLCVEPPLWPAAVAEGGLTTARWPAAQADARRAVQALTRQYASVLERYVRRAPAQWLMFRPVTGVPLRSQRVGAAKQGASPRVRFPRMAHRTVLTSVGAGVR